MSAAKPSLFARTRSVLAVIDAALVSAAAAEAGRRPPAGALRTLGIEPSRFPKRGAAL